MSYEDEKLFEQMEAEIKCLKQENHDLTSVIEKTELEKEHMQKHISELLRERQYHLGQIEAYRFALKGGAE